MDYYFLLLFAIYAVAVVAVDLSQKSMVTSFH
jgi:hypothetical protein